MTRSRYRTEAEAEQAVRPALRHNLRLDRIDYIAIDQLSGYARKLRSRSDRGAAALKASIASFGIVLPILIDKNNTIVGGEGIVAAARALGYTDVPTVRIEHLDEAEVRLLRIALNKLAEDPQWDRVELAAEFGELLSIETDLAYEVTGFETIEIDNLLHGPAPSDGEDPDDKLLEVGDPANVVSCLSDLWLLGSHRLLCGSSIELDQVSRVMNGELAQMVLTDAPYNVKIAGHVSGLGKHKHREFAQASGEMSEAEFTDFLSRSVTTLAACCVDGGLLYMFMDWRHQWELLSGIRAADLKMINMAVWVKKSGSMGSFYRSQHELCFIAKKGARNHRNNVQLGRFGRSRTNCWMYPGVNSFGPDRDELLSLHPTSKNVSMLSDAIRDASHRGEIVLDGFLGGGSTLIAAERTGRRCFGVELDPLYVDTIVRRWEKATGRTATLDGTAESFAEVAARRAAQVDRPEIVARPRSRAHVVA